MNRKAINLVRQSAAVVAIEFDRPEVMNAFSTSMMDEAMESLDEIRVDPNLRVVVIRGSGRAFSVGGDLTSGLEAFNGPPPLSRQQRQLRFYMDVVQLLRRLPQVTVAAVNGACAGAGMSIALACDIRVAAEKTRFNSGFLGAGVSGDFGGIWLATRILGSGAARSLFFRCEPFGSAEALRIGLVDRVFSTEALEEEVGALAEALAARAPVALQYMKRNLNDAEWMGLEQYLDVEAARHAWCVASPDAREAASAFRERRIPRFDSDQTGNRDA